MRESFSNPIEIVSLLLKKIIYNLNKISFNLCLIYFELIFLLQRYVNIFGKKKNSEVGVVVAQLSIEKVGIRIYHHAFF